MENTQTQEVDNETGSSPRILELGLAVFFLATCLFAFIYTWNFPEANSDRDPGTAVLPRYLSLGGVLFSAFLIVATLRRQDKWEIPKPGRPILLFIWTVICFVSEPFIGFILAITVFIFGVTRLFRISNLVVSAVFSPLVAVGVYLFFGNFLGIPL